MAEKRKKITVFHCVRALPDASPLMKDNVDVSAVKLACTSQVKDIYLLKAFEAGADGVVVLACPDGTCRYVEGNIRARKRIKKTRKLLDDIGLGSDKLSISLIPHGDTAAAVKAVGDMVENI